MRPNPGPELPREGLSSVLCKNPWGSPVIGSGPTKPAPVPTSEPCLRIATRVQADCRTAPAPGLLSVASIRTVCRVVELRAPRRILRDPPRSLCLRTHCRCTLGSSGVDVQTLHALILVLRLTLCAGSSMKRLGPRRVSTPDILSVRCRRGPEAAQFARRLLEATVLAVRGRSVPDSTRLGCRRRASNSSFRPNKSRVRPMQGLARATLGLLRHFQGSFGQVLRWTNGPDRSMHNSLYMFGMIGKLQHRNPVPQRVQAWFRNVIDGCRRRRRDRYMAQVECA